MFYKTYHRWSLFFTSCLWRQDKGTVRWRYPLRVIPMVNFFYDLFFDDSSINQDAARALLDVLGLLNALLLGGILTLMTAVDYETLKGVDELWWFVEGSGNFIYWHQYYGHPPSVQFNIWIGNSLILFFVGVLIVVYVYADSVAKVKDVEDLEDLNDESLTKEQRTLRWNLHVKRKDRALRLYTVWWEKAKYCVFVCFFTTIVAMIYAILAVQVLFNIKYPDYFINETGKYDLYELSSPTAHMQAFFYVCFGLGCVVTIICTGWGTASRYSKEDQYRLHDWYSSKLQQLIDLRTLLKNKKNADGEEEQPSDAEKAMRVGLLNVACAFFKFLCIHDEFMEAEEVFVKLEEFEDVMMENKTEIKLDIFNAKYDDMLMWEYILKGAKKLRDADEEHLMAVEFEVHTAESVIKELDSSEKPKSSSSRISSYQVATSVRTE